MKTQLCFAALALCLVVAKAQSCGRCIRSDCPAVSNCPGGTTFDECRCCRGCMKQEGETCKGLGNSHGFCGKGLICSYPEDYIGEAGIMISHKKFMRPGTCVRPYQSCQEACADDTVPTSGNFFSASGKSVILAPSFEKTGFWGYCDCTPGADKAWMVIQRRASGLIGFRNSLSIYEEGFGLSADGFWLGLKRINRFTSSGQYEAMIIVQYEDTYTTYSTYEHFQVGNAGSSYRLTLRGNAGENSLDFLQTHNGMKFSTFDMDNDNYPSGKCAEMLGSGWWHNRCTRQNLNGEHFGGYRVAQANEDGPRRVTWNACNTKKITTVEIRIRPVS